MLIARVSFSLRSTSTINARLGAYLILERKVTRKNKRFTFLLTAKHRWKSVSGTWKLRRYTFMYSRLLVPLERDTGILSNLHDESLNYSRRTEWDTFIPTYDTKIVLVG